MKLLVKPGSFKMLGNTPPPLGLLYLAGMVPDTVVWDEVVRGSAKDFIKFNKPKVVGVQVYTTSRHDSLEILEYAKKCGSITVAGGPHVAPMHKQMRQEYDFIDYFVSGDGEYAWRNITDFADNCATRPLRYIRNLVMKLDDLPFPNWDAIRVSDYPPNRINVVLGRGCDGNCTFCAAWWVNGKYRHHGPFWMEKHLNILGSKKVRHLVFQDDCLTNSLGAYDALTSALMDANYKFRWTGTTRVDKIEKGQIHDLRNLGCYSLGFGIESGSQTILDKINKETVLERALEVRSWCGELGVRFKALMMTGFPFETPETRQEDAEFRKKLNPDEWGSVGHVIVLPGTKLFKDLRKEGKISDDYWLGNEPYYKLG
jgi:radical SAM superfamily enzyme YgiQ (UPF0313 family)